MQAYDAIVIGGGPAGATAATLLAQKGRKVVLLEKEKFPRYSIGESLIPFCYFTLERLGMIDKIRAAGFTEKQSVQFVSPSGKVSQPFYFSDHFDHACSTTWQVDRASFDTMMLDNAREHGVTVLEETRVRGLTETNERVTGVTAESKAGETLEFEAPITIDCSGRDGFSMSRNRWRVPEKKLKKTAIWNYFKGAKRDEGRDEGATTIAYIPEKGWFWYIPLANDVVSVGVVAEKEYLFGETRELETIFTRELDNNPWVKKHLAGSTPLREYRATGDYSYRSRFCARDGLVLAGDAFSFLDPVFSSGVFLALAGGAMVADAIEDCYQADDFSASRFTDYAEAYRNGIEAMRKFVYAFYDPGFNMKAFLTRYPELRGDVTDCLIGNVFKDLNALFDAFDAFAEMPEPLAHGLPMEMARG